MLITFPPFSGRRPTWEDKESYEKLYEMHGLCDVSECLYTEGREQAEEEG